MRDISTKFTGDSYSAAEFNSSQVELENIVTSAGLTLDPAGGPDNNQNQLSQAAAAYACGGDMFGATGTVNAIVLAHTSLLKDPVAYVDKMRVTFKATGANTGAVTVNVDSIGIKKVLYPGGGDLIAGQIVAGAYTTFIYNTSLESGAGAFELMLYPSSTVQVVHRSDWNVESGGVAAGSWHTRTLNRIDRNEIGSAVSLSANKITLPAGRYDFFLILHGWDIGYTAVRLYNVTLAAKAWPTTTNVRAFIYYSGASDTAHQANISGSFTLAASSEISIQTYSTGAEPIKGQGEMIASSGGLASTIGGETTENVFLDCMFIRRNS